MPVKVSYKSNHGIQGLYEVPLDKSIAQRSAILGLSTNTGVEGEDIVSTKKAAKQIRSGVDNLCLDMGNSGTGMRLMAGFIAGLGIDAELVWAINRYLIVPWRELLSLLEKWGQKFILRRVSLQ